MARKAKKIERASVKASAGKSLWNNPDFRTFIVLPLIALVFVGLLLLLESLAA